MIYCVEITAAFNTAQRRDNVLGILQNYVAQFAADAFHPFQGPQAYDAAYKGWANAVACTMKLRTQANRDAIWADIQANAAGPGAPTKGVARRWDAALDVDLSALVENDSTLQFP